MLSLLEISKFLAKISKKNGSSEGISSKIISQIFIECSERFRYWSLHNQSTLCICIFIIWTKMRIVSRGAPKKIYSRFFLSPCNKIEDTLWILATFARVQLTYFSIFFQTLLYDFWIFLKMTYVGCFNKCFPTLPFRLLHA